MPNAYLAKYYAHQLTKRSAADTVEKLANSLADARVDLNPHQIDAALFAFHSPLSKGAILADEVGLGKTIEAGILLAQKWAERKRKLLIIVPASLRKQWSQELSDKFFLPSAILEAKTFNSFIKAGNLNPFDQRDEAIVIASYHFCRSKEPYLRAVSWDLVVIDEAHRLRNVYKPNARIAKSIKESVKDAPKVLLTATPLQNSLQELYGLVSLIDDYTFGDPKSFRGQFSNPKTDSDFASLRERLKPVCHRTLRRQVVEYIRYTNRIPITQEFVPSEEEQTLYDRVTAYLQQPNLYALPAGQRQLVTLILRKLLASSSFAIAGTLDSLIRRLEELVRRVEVDQLAPADENESVLNDMAPDFELLDELEEEWTDEENGKLQETRAVTAGELREIRAEILRLQGFALLARSIARNSKGEVLLTALDKGFQKLKELGAKERAIIFTESTRTQNYLVELLSSPGSPYAGRVMLFNGTNTDSRSKEIYRDWVARHKGTDKVAGSPSADMRAALVDYFRDEALIMIATEAAAEGINLQFCSLVVNYDLPWNPQRIEQRIGRCHRYGQQFDVVVVNFLNKKNAADERVFHLLSEKFELFSGVFGASDEVLGTIESGVDFEKRIAQIYQTCRTPDQINTEFDALQQELNTQINERLRDTRQKLLENFDEEVVQRLRVRLRESQECISKVDTLLWSLTRWFLREQAEFSEEKHAFSLLANPFPALPTIVPGVYVMDRTAEFASETHLYRIGHPLAQAILAVTQTMETPIACLEFASTGRKIAALESLRGKSGWLAVTKLTVSAFETQDELLLCAVDDNLRAIAPEVVEKLFTLDCTVRPLMAPEANQQKDAATALDSVLETSTSAWLTRFRAKNATYFEAERAKMESWADDLIKASELELQQTKNRIRDLNRDARAATDPAAKLSCEREIADLESRKRRQRQRIFDVEDEITAQRDALISRLEARLTEEVDSCQLFIVRWML